MLSALKFVQGSIAKKDLIPSLTSFVIEGGFVRGFNGTLALCAPLPLTLTARPRALPFIAAIAQCNGPVSVTLTPAGRLSVKSGSFRTLIDCIQEETLHVLPEGEVVEINGKELLKALKVVQPFIGTDATRPWSGGVLFKGQSCYATCNTALIEYWTGFSFPHTINLPIDAAKELIRIGEPAKFCQLDSNSITFHFEDGRWLRTQLKSTEWPDLEKILNRESNQSKIDTELFVALEALKPFVDKNSRVYIKPGFIATHREEDEGTHYEVPSINFEAIHDIRIISLLEGVADTVDLASWPSANLFFGDRLRGAIIGLKP